MNIKKQIPFLFILIWIFSLLVTLYTLLSSVFIASFFSFFHFSNTSWEIIFSNLITCVLVLIYTKELLFGYQPNSKKQNKLSLLFYGFLIVALILLQYHTLFSLMTNFDMSRFWTISISIIVITTTYLGLLFNRILKISSFV